MMTLSEASHAVDGEQRGKDVEFTGVTSDSRTITPGDLFVALRGEKFDGHDFVESAVAQGAIAALVEKSFIAKEIPVVVVPNTKRALGVLASYWRNRFKGPVVCITGSNGKTTVKEMLALILDSACKEQTTSFDSKATPGVLATQGNLNNDIGVPLMLLRLRKAHQYAVIEMGMNHVGEISYLTNMARPDIAVITNAGAAHLEGLGTVEAVARAKGEIFEGLSPDGVAVINADDPYSILWNRMVSQRRVIEFGLEHRADVMATYRLGVYESEVEMHLPDGDISIRLQVPGMHNVRNALAAAAAASALRVNAEAIANGLNRFHGVKGRLQRKVCKGGAVLIDDTYNANPESVRAALAVLGTSTGKRIFVLGDMGELGPNSEALHARIGEQARQAGTDMLLALGPLSERAVKSFGTNGRHFEQIDDLIKALEELLGADVTVLVKGSRFMQMERVVQYFNSETER